MALTVVSRANAVPITLTSPTRYLSATQAHAAGNCLVALFHLNNGTVVSVTNTAGDTWIRSALSPYLTGTIHHHEMWYCLSTLGNPADVLTVFVTGEAELAITVYELATSAPSLQAQYVGDAAANIQVDGGSPPTINSGAILLTRPSLLLALYRDSLGTAPTSPSGTQFAALNTGGVTSYYDCWQTAPVSAAVTAIAGATNTFPQWSILASAFTESAGVGFGCAQDLPASGSSGGVGCSTDIP